MYLASIPRVRDNVAAAIPRNGSRSKQREKVITTDMAVEIETIKRLFCQSRQEVRESENAWSPHAGKPKPMAKPICTSFTPGGNHWSLRVAQKIETITATPKRIH
jgi:hypothetical protein